MAWTYSGNPGASPLDEVRFLIQDTDSTSQLLSNEELNYLLASYEDPYSAAVAAVVSLIGKASRSEEESKKVGDLSLTRKAGARVAQWEALKRHLEAERFRRFPAAPVVNPNAILPTDEAKVEGEGTDYVVGQMDNRT
jgi:uncharacterized SAM-binding protein YcdF (DUF218 family)